MKKLKEGATINVEGEGDDTNEAEEPEV